MSADLFDQTVCTPEQQAGSGASGFFCYTRRQNIGLLAVSLVGFTSLVAVVAMLGLIIRNKLRTRKLPKSERPRLNSMEIFVVSLLFGDLFQSLGAVMDVRWINDGIVRVGRLCTAQGVLQNIGQAAIAMTTFIITLHTFDLLWRHGGVQSLKWAYTLVGIVWTFLILTVVISTSVHREPSFYAPTPYWCWINDSYPKYRIAIENFWLWIGFAVAILYIPLLFWFTGHITPGEPEWWTFKLNRGQANRSKRSTRLIICALAYCLPVLPTSLARWFLVVHGDVKPFATAEAQFIVKAIFSLSGVCDVIAIRFARSDLPLFSTKNQADTSSEKADITTSAAASERSRSSESLANADGSETEADNKDEPAESNTSRRRWRLPLGICGWLAINALYAVWVTYYIGSATNPNPRTAVNRSHAGWQVYFLFLYLFGFLWGCVNIVVWIWYFQSTARKPVVKSRLGISSTLLPYARGFARYFILLPISVVMGLGPFFAPVAGVRIAQQQAWLHRCDSFMVEVVLDGLSFNAPAGQKAVASFSFRQPDGSLELRYQYNLTNDNASISHLTLWSGPDVASASQVQDITYDFDNFTLLATCAGNLTQCSSGSFQESGYLSFSLTNSSDSSTVNLRAVDKVWDYGKSDDAPSFLLKEVQSDDTLGDLIVRTAVTNAGHCQLLKMCANNAEIETLAPVGLALLKQSEYAKVCTTPNSN
ncbi:hypothetical protein GGX14DRAFT_607415 [Mycena pura]|uniref:Glucose receptor Git3 N-terminal domain-containing protein n=1 Tax=Mycena pura TaxID=153505 RepID=A0AAD6ULW0_9AGAR|nr:hypothetical protein GGX14DRAFT_607415 [Mycena pura]